MHRASDVLDAPDPDNVESFKYFVCGLR